MKQLPLVSASIAVMLASSPAFAVDLGSHAVNAKRQMAACMFKRMRADRAISYIDSKRACADDLNGGGASLASSNTPARGEHVASPAKPGS